MIEIFKKPINTIDTRKFIKLLMSMIIVISAVVLAISFKMSEVKTFIQQNQEQTLLISLIIYVIAGIAFLPSAPLTVFIVVLVGPFQAVAVATLGNTLAAFIQYQIGKSVGDVIDFEEKKSKLPFGLDKLPVHSPLFMLTARSVPVGTRAYSMVCGAYCVPIPVYLWTTFVMFLINS
ncbi:MAG: VTT domain-containing protein, partial [Chloroflexota bacterium]|nr:VTT domain-containing protein [Chloroflexota bacterium]